MATHQISIALAVLACSASGQAQSPATAGSPQLVQAFIGFNQPNTQGAPCANCFGVYGVVVQPNQFVSSGSTGLYYAVFQENGWTGSVSTTFHLSAAGTVIQTMVLNGTVTSGQGWVVLSGNATIPTTTYSGPADLTATTTATPADGLPPFALSSYGPMVVGTTGAHHLVQAFAIYSSSLFGSYPCLMDCVAGLPGAMAVQPAQFQQPGVTAAASYVFFQADGWKGQVHMNFDVVEAGKVVFSQYIGGYIGGQAALSVSGFGVDGGAPGGGYVGPAILNVTTTAVPQYGVQTPFTLKSSSVVEVEAP